MSVAALVALGNREVQKQIAAAGAAPHLLAVVLGCGASRAAKAAAAGLLGTLPDAVLPTSASLLLKLQCIEPTLTPMYV